MPKVDNAQMISQLSAAMDRYDGFENTQIWAMMETPRGILNAAEIADAPRMGGMVMGTNDLAKDLNTRFDPTRAPLLGGVEPLCLSCKSGRNRHC